MGLEEELALALKNPGYTDALLALLKNILVDRSALNAVGEWAALYDVGLIAQARSATTSSGALSIGCLRRIAPPCRRGSCWPS